MDTRQETGTAKSGIPAGPFRFRVGAELPANSGHRFIVRVDEKGDRIPGERTQLEVPLARADLVVRVLNMALAEWQDMDSLTAAAEAASLYVELQKPWRHAIPPLQGTPPPPARPRRPLPEQRVLNFPHRR